MTDLAKCAERFVNGSQTQWSELVEIALALKPGQVQKAAERLGKLAQVSPKTVKQKLLAIRLAREAGNTPDQIKQTGASAVLGLFVKTKNAARTDKQVLLSWKVAPELRDAAHAETLRIAQVLGFTTSNELWTWLTAQLATTTDEELLHSAGMSK